MLLAVLTPEVHSATAAAFLAQASAPLAISSWSVTELHSALGIKVRTKAQALELFRQIDASGESLVNTDHGRPALEVRPYRPIDFPTADPPGGAAGFGAPQRSRLSPWAGAVVESTTKAW